PLAKASGWSDLSMRVAMMRRFAYWENKGNQPVLLYCGDHDPGGLNISGFLRSNIEERSRAVGWSPDNLIVALRKGEGEPLVQVPKIGRRLGRQAILKYVSEKSLADYDERLRKPRNQVREEVLRLLAEEGGAS